ncbi:MAG: glycosyltransferase family 39 protein [Anaerolineales bacterium]|nr:glycosyltransferase family 39 protein [Anaerolineales bacterium]
MSDLSVRSRNLLIALIIIAYLVVGVLYAVKTPPWQVPDEPAHYNYIKYLAENYRFPVLQMGDYPHHYLEEIKGKQFPPEMSIEPLRYEFHQPPLYYVLAAVVYKLFAGRLLPLRLLSVLLGCCLLWVAYHIAKEIFPENEALALGTTAFVAFVPMHSAITAAVNNDTLAELILAVILWMLVRYVKLVGWSDGRMVGWSKETPDHLTKDHLTTRPMGGRAGGMGRFVGLGVLMGLGLLTKITTLVALPLTLVAIIAKGRWLDQNRKSDFTRRYLLSAICILLPALLLTLPWFARNTVVYGGLDIFGLQRHDAIVVKQPRTAEWLAQLGATGLAKEFILTTFKSFWAKFGWMAILVDERIYFILALLCAVVGLGLVLFVIRNVRQRMLTSSQRMALGLLALSALFTLLSHLWYNLKFVQHQGRYLFPALIPIGLAFALGLREVLARDNAKAAALLFLAGVLILAAKGLITGDFNKLSILLLGGAAVAFGIKALLPEKYDDLVFALPYLGLLGLDLICLFKFIVPYFQS